MYINLPIKFTMMSALLAVSITSLAYDEIHTCYKYKTNKVSHVSNSTYLNSDANKMSKEGWTLVTTMLTSGNGDVFATYRRPIPCPTVDFIEEDEFYR